MKSMRRIPLDDQVMLELHYMQSLSRREMAEIFQRKEPTIAGQLRRARRRLAAKMAEVAQSREVLLSTSKSAASWLHELAQHLGAMTSERA